MKEQARLLPMLAKQASVRSLRDTDRADKGRAKGEHWFPFSSAMVQT